MEKLIIKRNTFSKLNNYCSTELLSSVLSTYGNDNIEIDETDVCEDRWEITDFIKNEDISLLDKLKVICVFDHLLGDIIYGGEITQYSILCHILKSEECNQVLFYWIHSKAKGNTPYYDVGEIIIPKL